MRRFAFFPAIFCLITFLSCNKEDVNTPSSPIQETDLETVNEDAFITTILNVAEEDADVGSIEGELKATGLKSTSVNEESTSCALRTVTIDQPEDPSIKWIITIDFGQEGCVNNYGINRTGKIIITRYTKEAEYRRKVTFENYYVNNNKVEGTKLESHWSLNEEQLPISHWSKELTLTTPEGVIFHRSAEKDRTMIAGSETPFYGDNEYLIEGYHYTFRENGEKTIEKKRTIISPLHRKASCRFIVSGEVKIERTNAPTLILDYGNGECDNLATLTNEEGVSRDINLKFQGWKPLIKK